MYDRSNTTKYPTISLYRPRGNYVTWHYLKNLGYSGLVKWIRDGNYAFINDNGVETMLDETTTNAELKRLTEEVK